MAKKYVNLGGILVDRSGRKILCIIPDSLRCSTVLGFVSVNESAPAKSSIRLHCNLDVINICASTHRDVFCLVAKAINFPIIDGIFLINDFSL